MSVSPLIHGSCGGKCEDALIGVDEAHVHRLLGVPDVGREGGEQHADARRRRRTRPRRRGTAAGARWSSGGSARRASRRSAPPVPRSSSRSPSARSRSAAQQPGDGEQDQHAHDQRHAVGDDVQRRRHPDEPRDEQQPEDLREAEPGAGQAPEQQPGDRRGDRPTTSTSTKSPSAATMRRGKVPSVPVWPLYELVADLPLRIDGYALERLARTVSSGFERVSTVFVLARRRRARARARTSPTRPRPRRPSTRPARCSSSPASGRSASFSAHLAGSTSSPATRRSRPSTATTAAGGSSPRRWTSRCARPGTSLHERARPRRRSPSRSSSPRRMGEPPTLAPVDAPARPLPGAALQARRHADWSDELIAELVATARGRLDRLQGRLQGHGGRHPDRPGPLPPRSPRRSRTPGSRTRTSTTEDARRALAAHQDRITWDAPIHSVEDILAAPVMPRTVNLKPSRFGSVKALFEATSSASSAGWAPTAAASTSSASAATRSSCWPRSSTRTARTTSPRAATTRSIRSRACPSSPLDPRPAATGFRRDLD